MADRGLDDVAVAEVAGDGLCLGGRLDDDETTFGHGCPFRVGDGILPGDRPGARVTIATPARTASVRNGRYWHGRCPGTLVRAGRICSSARSATRSTRSCSRAVEGRGTASWRRRVRPRRQPLVELRPVAARDAALPSPVPALHGEVRAVLVPARPVHRSVRRVSRATGAARPGGRRHRGPALPDGPRRRDVPRGDSPQKGLRKRHEARWRTGAARIALEAGVPLVPAGITGTSELARLGR